MVELDIMLLIEEVHRAKEVEGRAQRPLAAGRAVLMLDDDSRLVANDPTRLSRPQAPVQVLAVHEEPLVEQADLLDYGAAHQHARAADRVDIAWQVGVEVGEVVTTETAAAREQAAESRQSVERHFGRRKRPPRRQVQGA